MSDSESTQPEKPYMEFRAIRAEHLLDEAVELLTGITGKVGQSRYDLADVRAFLTRLGRDQ